MQPGVAWWIVAAMLYGLASAGSLAATFQLSSGQSVQGEPMAPDEQGVIFKIDSTKFSARIAWTNFTEAALRAMAEDPKIRPFVRSLIEEEPDLPVTRRERSKVEVATVERVERPPDKQGLGALWTSPLALILFGLLYAANLYAGYKVAFFRNYNVIAVCGVSGILPVLGPILFLCLPTNAPGEHGAEEHEASDQEQALAEAAVAAAAAEHGEGGAQTHAAAKESTGQSRPAATVYQRGEYTFNRRFFETKLSGFLRVIPSDAEKDLVVAIESAGGKHVGNRILRIMPNEIYLQISKGGASSEVAIAFNDIKTVTVRHKDS